MRHERTNVPSSFTIKYRFIPFKLITSCSTSCTSLGPLFDILPSFLPSFSFVCWWHKSTAFRRSTSVYLWRIQHCDEMQTRKQKIATKKKKEQTDKEKRTQTKTRKHRQHTINRQPQDAQPTQHNTTQPTNLPTNQPTNQPTTSTATTTTTTTNNNNNNNHNNNNNKQQHHVCNDTK